MVYLPSFNKETLFKIDRIFSQVLHVNRSTSETSIPRVNFKITGDKVGILRNTSAVLTAYKKRYPSVTCTKSSQKITLSNNIV